jgi:GrpB-like predicted nucleotidyltransferase (UPF0157 family)
VKEYFGLQIDNNKQRMKARYRRKLREDEAVRTEYVDLETENDDHDLEAALRQLREEHEYRKRAGQ